MLLRMAADQERADRIRALKQQRPDLTWRRIADYVGVTERSATDWQTKGGIEYANAEKLAKLFEVDVDYIWRGTPEGDRAPSPFAGQDALADRLDRIEQRIQRLIEEQDERLRRQDEVLARIEAAITRESRVRDEAQAATEALLAAVGVANQALLAGSRDTAEARGPRAT